MAIRILQLKKLRKTDSHVTGVRTGSSECQAKRIIICCALDFVGQNPMLAITVDNERPVRSTGSCQFKWVL